MIIDFHTHTFPDAIASAAVRSLRAASHTRPFSDGTATGLKESMAAGGIDLSVILPVATKARQVPHINDGAARINETCGETGLLSFGCAHPDMEDPAGEIRRLKARGIPGIKLHPPYQGAPIDDSRYLRILQAAGEEGLIVTIHAGIDIGLPDARYAMPEMIRRAVDQAGPVTLVLAHMGSWRCWDQLGCLEGTHVYLDTSFSLGKLCPDGEGYHTGERRKLLDPERFIHLCRVFGMDHILFGTDSPWADQGKARADIEALPLTEDEKRAILGGNAARLLGLPSPAGRPT